MKSVISALCFILLTFSLPMFAAFEKIVIAHRGASGYLPEHTLQAKVMAYAQGADYIEQDVVMTSDNQLVVLHDIFLERVSNISSIFPKRARADGHFYVVDFSLKELRLLSISEAFIPDGNNIKAIYPKRFPVWKSTFKIHTLREELELIIGLNQSTGKNVGIYTEIKSPWFFHNEGKDISLAVVKLLKEYGYTDKNHKVYLQTFDFNELKRIHNDLLPALDMKIKLVQLIAENDWNETFELDTDGSLKPYDYSWMHSAEGIKKLANYADGLGPALSMIVLPQSTKNNLIFSSLVNNAHSAGLEVHPYTFRLESNHIPAYASSFDELVNIFLFQANVDGIFTDFPDLAIKVLEKR